MNNLKEKLTGDLNLTSTDRFMSDSCVPKIVTSAIRNSNRSQADVARELSLNSNLITMFKQGSTKVPIARAKDLAIALELPELDFVRLLLEEYHSDILVAIERSFALSIDEKETQAFLAMRQFLEQNPDVEASDIKISK